jgi:cystathionine gamma-synthase
VLRAAREMTAGLAASEASFAALRGLLDDADLTDLVLTIAFYNAVVRFLATMQVDVEPQYQRYLDRFPLPEGGGECGPVLACGGQQGAFRPAVKPTQPFRKRPLSSAGAASRLPGMTDSRKPDWAPRTLAAQAMGHIDAATQAVVPPIHITTTYIRDPDNQYRTGNIYARPDNQTVREAEAMIAMLEGAPVAMVLGSGMSAATAVFLSHSPGDHVVAAEVMYWGLRNWLINEGRHWGLEIELVDTTDLAALRAAMRPGKTKLIWLESPSNPLWTVTDIRAAAEIAHAAGARLAVDSTVATPVLTRPLALGADLVMHSATKYLNGHSDMVGGMVVVGDNAELAEQLAFLQNSIGAVQGPFDSFLALRGLKTLHLRMRAHCENAQALAGFLQTHPAVDKGG